MNNCGNCIWWERIIDHRGTCHWPVPLIPRIAMLIRNVAWEKEEDCPVHEEKLV